MNARTTLNNIQETDCLKIAEMELKEKKIPLMIERHLPNGKIEYWKISEVLEGQKQISWKNVEWKSQKDVVKALEEDEERLDARVDEQLEKVVKLQGWVRKHLLLKK